MPTIPDVDKKILASLFDDTCQMMAAPGFSTAEAEDIEIEKGYRAEVAFRNKEYDSEEHAVVVRCSEQFGSQIASAMFQLDVDEISDELIEDALGELANILGGNLLEYYSEDVESTFPTVESWDEDSEPPDRQQLCRLVGYCSQQPIEIEMRV
jgi:hypothetical protein